MIGNRTKVFRFLLLAFLLLSALFACQDLFGPLDNPVDRESENYQGYESTQNADEIKSFCPLANARLAGISTIFIVSEIIGANFYQLEISSSQSNFDDNILINESDYTSNKIIIDIQGFSNTVWYYWRARAQKNGLWGKWTEISSFMTNGGILLGGAIQGNALNLKGEVTTLAGSSEGDADGIGTSAQFYGPDSITTDGTNLYIADTINNRIRKIVIVTREVTTLAGSSEGDADGIGTSAQFFYPRGITTDGTNLYVADFNNNIIRKIVISTGEVTTLAGSSQGYADGIGTSAQFFLPSGITTDGTNLYVADSDNNRIRKIVISTGEVTTLAGSSYGYADGIGSSAQFYYPDGITTDGTNLYIADTYNHRIRKIVIATAEVTTLAGSSEGYANGIGTSAQFAWPNGITTDGTNLYVADNNKIRCIK